LFRTTGILRSASLCGNPITLGIPLNPRGGDFVVKIKKNLNTQKKLDKLKKFVYSDLR
jgi:hypothetical protein